MQQSCRQTIELGRVVIVEDWLFEGVPTSVPSCFRAGRFPFFLFLSLNLIFI